MAIKIFNTLTRKDENLKLIDESHLKMYVCGPTVYDRPHLGNARSAVVYDMFYRLFLKTYGRVTYVRNITDVDDKINKAAKERGVSIQDLTNEYIDYYHQDMDALNVLRPTLEPRATDYIAEMVEMIATLIGSGHAYESDGHVLFDVESYDEYGELSRRSLDEMVAGARVEVASYKKNPLDFVLWKPAAEADDESSVFDSPWSRGRPGWHIECSAMSSKFLGVNYDIHGGGADLQFPHHENEIAQSKCANHGSFYAKYWIHNGFLTVNGEKMSKSLKNFISLCDLLDKGVRGSVIRYVFLSTHYRKPLDYNLKSLDDAKKSLEKFYGVFDSKLLERYLNNRVDVGQMNSGLLDNVVALLQDDLNLAKVIAYLHGIAKEVGVGDEKLKLDFIELLDFLGLLDGDYFKVDSKKGIDADLIEAKIATRKQAKADRDFALADQIRDELLAMGVVIEDKAGGEVEWSLR